MKKLIAKHRALWTSRSFLSSVLLGAFFLVGSLVVNYAAGTFAAEKASNSVTDLFLDNLPIMNVEIIFVEGILIFLLFVAALLMYEPKQLPFVLKSIALFIFIRSLFITLTHIGPFPEQINTAPPDFFRAFTFGGDLFFSGHTGLPFLMALTYWKNKYLRVIFVLMSLVAGTSVLLGHLHYSIDVFAAFFITYGIFEIARWMFAKDYGLFLRELSE